MVHTVEEDKVEEHIGITHLVHAQKFPKTNISHPLICIRLYVYEGVRNVSFLENFE